MYVLLKMNPAEYAWMVQWFHSVQRFAISLSDVLCLCTGINSFVRQPKSHDCQIWTGYTSRERMAGDVCLTKSPGYYMKLALKIRSCCTVHLTILILVTVKTQILVCTSWSNVPTFTYKMQLASILSISCNIQHLAQWHGPHKLQCSMLRKRTFHHFAQANPANRQRVRHDDVIKWMKARVVWCQKVCEPLGHCIACDPKSSLLWRNEGKLTL